MAALDPQLTVVRPRSIPMSGRWPALSSHRTVAVIAVVSLLLLVALPILMLVFSSIRGPYGSLPFESFAYFTADNFAQALSYERLGDTIRDTVLYVGGAVAIAMAVGFALAWVVERSDIPFSRVIFVAVLIPFLLPQSFVTSAWLPYLLPRTGTVNVFLRDTLGLAADKGPIDPYNIQTMIIFQGLILTPIVFLVLAATLRNMNGAMEEVSRTSGAHILATLRRVTVPLAFPGAFTAAVLGVWLTLDSSSVPTLLGGITRVSLLNFRIWASRTSVSGEFPGFGQSAAYAVLAMFVLFLLFAVYAVTTRHAGKYATVTGNSMRAPKTELGMWAIPVSLFVFAYLGLMWGLPGYRLVRGSIVAGFSGYWAQLTNERFQEAVFNSAVLAIGSATLGTIVVVMVAWTVVRARSGSRKMGLDLLATMSLVIPATMAGVAFLLVFLTVRGTIPLYGSAIGVIYALAYRVAIPYRITNASMQQVGKDMEEVSATSGGSPLTTLRYVTMPILAPAISISWTIFFIFSVRETALVRYLGYLGPTLGSGAGRLRGAPPGAAAAATVLTIVFILTVILAVRYLLFRRARIM